MDIEMLKFWIPNISPPILFLVFVGHCFRHEVNAIGSTLALGIRSLPAWCRDWIETWDKMMAARDRWKRPKGRKRR